MLSNTNQAYGRVLGRRRFFIMIIVAWKYLANLLLSVRSREPKTALPVPLNEFPDYKSRSTVYPLNKYQLHVWC